MAAEFAAYPAHEECFDQFDSADEFLLFAKQKVELEKQPRKAPPRQPEAT